MILEPLYETELAVLRNVLWGEPLNLPEDLDDDALWRELQLQAVDGLASAAAWPQSVPEETRKEYERRHLMWGMQFYRYLYAQEQLLELLADHGIPVIILKGTAAAISYPEPELRNMGDIDFLVSEDHYIRTYEILASNGYALSEPIDSAEKHISLNKSGVSFELHRNFGTITDPKLQQVMKRQLAFALTHRAEAVCRGSNFPIAPVLQNGLLLLQHAAQHMYEGIGLRHAIDWMMYVHKYLDDAFWESSFQAAAAELGLAHFAMILTAMCRRYLGLPDDLTWCEEGDKSAYHLMAYILEHGNFGRKMDTDSHDAQVRLNHGIGGLFRALQKSGMRHWKAAKKYKILRPFAWIFGGVYYVGVLIRRRHGIAALSEDLKASRQARGLFEELQLP